jgi:hypothetical protein
MVPQNRCRFDDPHLRPCHRCGVERVAPCRRPRRQSYTWAEATRDQQMEEWLRAHMHAFDYWGGVRRWPFPTMPGLV